MEAGCVLYGKCEFLQQSVIRFISGKVNSVEAAEKRKEESFTLISSSCMQSTMQEKKSIMDMHEV